MSEFTDNLYKGKTLDNYPILAQQLWYLSKQGFEVVDIEPFQFARTINVATDATFDILPALNNVVYLPIIGHWSKTSTTQTGTPFIDFYNPFTPFGIGYRYSGSSMPNNTVTLNLGMANIQMLTSRVQWNDNAATVGSFSVSLNGFKLTLQ